MFDEIRLLVTDICNYNCTFCHGEGIQIKRNGKTLRELSPNDYLFIVNTAKRAFNISNVTLTGGEPSTRSDIIDIVKNIYSTGINITLVTNGSRLLSAIRSGVAKYVKQFNISIHSLDPAVYKNLTGGGNIGRIVKNIELLRTANKDAVIHLNIVITKGLIAEGNAISDLIQFAKKVGALPKFIEMFDSQKGSDGAAGQMGKKLLSLGFHGVSEQKRGTTFYNDKLGISARVEKLSCEIVRELKTGRSEACRSLNSLTITPGGKIKTCLIRNNENIDAFEAITARDEKKFVELLKAGLAKIGSECPFNGDTEGLKDAEGPKDIEDIIK